MHQAMKPAPTKEFKTILFVDLEYKHGQVSLQRETERKKNKRIKERFIE